MSNEFSLNDFLITVVEHEMKIIHADGVFRHVRFARPGTGIDSFTLTTWPGYLCIAGDIGTYVFRRLHDMFEFFRSPRAGLRINPGYWAEKCEAIGRAFLFRVFDEGLLKDVLHEYYVAFYPDPDDRKSAEAIELLEEINSEVGCAESEEEAKRLMRDFEHASGFTFSDSFECRLTTWSPCFLRCLWAITWGISVFDDEIDRRAKSAAVVP
jgi:hypothetical protein